MRSREAEIISAIYNSAANNRLHIERDVEVCILQGGTRPLGDISCIHEVRKLMVNGTSTREHGRIKLLNHSCVTSALFVLARARGENIRNENS